MIELHRSTGSDRIVLVAEEERLRATFVPYIPSLSSGCPSTYQIEMLDRKQGFDGQNATVSPRPQTNRHTPHQMRSKCCCLFQICCSSLRCYESLTLHHSSIFTKVALSKFRRLDVFFNTKITLCTHPRALESNLHFTCTLYYAETMFKPVTRYFPPGNCASVLYFIDTRFQPRIV
jgi:hypothetical protein